MDIEQFLKHMNFTRAEFAERVGISRMTIGRYINRVSHPQHHIAEIIAKYTNYLITVEELGWDKNKKKLPYTKKALGLIYKDNGKDIYIDGSSHALDPTTPERK